MADPTERDWSFDPAAVSPLAGHWIGAGLHTGGDRGLPVRRPSDGQVHGEVPQADAGVVDAAVKAALAAQPGWARLAPRDRARLLFRWADLVQERAETLVVEESVVSARICREAANVDVPAAANWIRFYAEYADKFEGTVTASGDQALSLVVHEPYGVVAGISPWNFPLVLAVWKAAPAMAAGNAVIIKPSELTPYSMTRMAELAVEAGIPPGILGVLHGTGSTAGSALVRHPDVACVTFTGSTATGAQIMTDAAQSGLKPVSLELGGKTPQLVFADCGAIEPIADQVAWGITRNSGQLCYAGSRLVVHRDVEAQLVAAIAARLEKLRAGPTWDAKTTLAPIISEKQGERMQSLVDTTLAEGGELVIGGCHFRGDKGGVFFEPTIIRHLRPDMTGFREEIFGPVLGVQVFDDDAEGVALAQHPTYGLAGSIYTQSLDKAMRAARVLQTGTVWVNTWGRKPDMTSPFGGYKQSGFGKDAGKAGFIKFLRSKAIWIDLPES